jgi:hypothetical protein
MIAMALSGNQEGRLMWPSFDVASRLYDWANIFLIGALVIGAVSTVLVVWMGNIKEEYLRRNLATLEAHSQELRAANLALEEKIQPRRISGERSEKMVEILSAVGHNVPIAIVSRIFDPEAKDFADDLASVFTKAKWVPVRYENWTRSDKGVFIATVEGTALPPELEKVIAAALDANNTEHKTITISGDDISRVSPHFQPHVLYLLVGAKP